MTTTVKFYFDLMSPYAYLAHTQLPALVERHGAVLEYHPVDLAALKLLVGNTGPSNRDIPIKHRYLRHDLQRWATAYGVPFCPPAGYGSLRITAGALYARDRGCCRAFVDWMWAEVWGKGRAMNDDRLLADAARQFRWPELPDLVSSETARERLEASTRAAHDAGVFGVPVMQVADQLWWGNDRLDFLDGYLRARSPSSP